MHECARGGMDDDDAVNDDVDDDVDETHRADDETYFHPSRRSRRLPLTRVASSPLTRSNPPIIVSRSYLSRANARHAPARARRRRRRGRARPWTPFRRIRSNPRERRRAWWICRSFVARASSVVARSFLGARAAASPRHPRTFSLAGTIRSLDRVDDAVSTTRARAGATGASRG